MNIAADAKDVVWDVSGLTGDGSIEDLFDEADRIAEAVAARWSGSVATLTNTELAQMYRQIELAVQLASRASTAAGLLFYADSNEENSAAFALAGERAAKVDNAVLFADLEWASVPDERAAAADTDELDFVAYHLKRVRADRQYLLSEEAEVVVRELGLTATDQWVRLVDQDLSSVTVVVGDQTHGLFPALGLLADPDREQRRESAAALTRALNETIDTRVAAFNALLQSKATQDRLRSHRTWLSARNLANAISDESVEALVAAVTGRYGIAQRWYETKAAALGLDRLADYDRTASVGETPVTYSWAEGTRLVADAYESFSPELAEVAARFFTERRIDAAARPGKHSLPFASSPTGASEPYVLVDWNNTTRDVLVLAHELGHGIHQTLSMEQSVFHFAAGLTMDETASVFGETLTLNHLADTIENSADRFTLLAATMENTIGALFRQISIHRFEDLAHTERRSNGELSRDRIGELWMEAQTEFYGSSVDLTPGYETWWSYIPHVFGMPGYVYAYAYAQLFALSLYAKYETEGDAFVPAFVELLKTGGSKPPIELGRIVGCDLNDPGFWDAGLDIVENQLATTRAAAVDAGRI